MADRAEGCPVQAHLDQSRGWEFFLPSTPLLEQSFCLREVKFIFLPSCCGCALHTHTTTPTLAVVGPLSTFLKT